MAHALVHTALCVADAAELGHSALSSGCRPAAPQRRRRPGGRRHACICHGASALASPADAATFPALVWSEDSAPESRLAWGHVGATRLHCEPAGAASRTAARVVAGDAAEAECRTASQSSGASAPHALLDVPPWLASEADGQPVPPPGGGPPGGPTPENEYYLQCGVAIRTIRDEFPHIFSRDLSYDIYRDDVVFTDAAACMPGVPAQAVGKDAYKRVFWSLRLHGAVFFARPPLVSILRIWQPRDGLLAVRWSIAAQPRLLSSFGADDVHFDGVSEYKLDRAGRIYEHRVNNIDMITQEPLKSRSLAALLASLAPSQLPTPSFLRRRRPAADLGSGCSAQTPLES